jgi:hypothetical protein
MYKIIVYALLIAAGIYGYDLYQSNPSVIRNPVYVESRMVWYIPQMSRELEYVLVGEMVSEADCQQRSERYLNKLFEECKECKVKVLKCDSNLDKRYRKLFSGQKTHTTYLSLDRGNRFERNARMVIWGLTVEEAGMACEIIKKMVKKKYSGSVECVAGRPS